MAHDRYISPFSTRYASDEMQYTFSDDNKFRTWRRLWIALAKAEQKQGLDITDEQISELEAHKDDINYEEATAREKLVRHDVMSHVYAYGLQCPKAKGIIHLGATSCYVGDNTDVIIMREGLQLVRKKLIGVLANLADFAEQYKDMPCLAYTHCQPAQLTTVGKRATLWMNEFYMDLQEIDHQISQLALRGVKGTTGTQASFLELFDGDHEKCRHEPWVQHIQRRVQRRNARDKYVGDDTDAVELVKYVIHCDGQHDAVAQIVKKRFPHHFPSRRWRLIRLVLCRMESRIIPQIRA